MSNQMKYRSRGNFPRLLRALAMLLAAGCSAHAESPSPSGSSGPGIAHPTPSGRIERATATIQPASESNVYGTVTFEPAEDGSAMLIEIDISGLSPGKHGFHIHAIGDCSAPDATSAGGHLNPYDAHHGGPRSVEHHLGDLGNIVADDNGRARTELRDPELAFSGTNSILGRAVVVHAGEDDLTSDPAGNAGARVGCGVIHQKKAAAPPVQKTAG